MTLSTIRATIEQRIAADMTQAPPLPIKWGNAPFNPPNNAPWLDVSIRYGEDFYATIAGFNQQNGVIAFNIYTPAGGGATPALVIADRIKALFNRINTGGIIFNPADGPTLVPSAPEAYCQHQLTVAFQAYQ